MNTAIKHTDLYLKFSKCIVKYRHLFVVCIFLLQSTLANYLAFVIRFDATPSTHDMQIFLVYLPLLLIIRLAFFIREGLYKGLWRYASTSDLMKIIKSTTIGSSVFLLVVYYLTGDTEYPRSVYVLDLM